MQFLRIFCVQTHQNGPILTTPGKTLARLFPEIYGSLVRGVNGF
jgi:hypothetical protein